jgi:uncharacterized membrane protein
VKHSWGGSGVQNLCPYRAGSYLLLKINLYISFYYYTKWLYMVEYTYIRLKKDTVEKLKKIGSKNETYDDIINRLIKEAKKLES